MKINGINGANTQIGGMNMMQSNDSVSKNLQNQIANAQKQLQELSSNKEMSLEEKMKKRQEIQQQIARVYYRPSHHLGRKFHRNSRNGSSCSLHKNFRYQRKSKNNV